MQKFASLVSYSFTVHIYRWLRLFGGVFLALGWLGLSAAQAQTNAYALGTSALVVGPASGTNSVVLAVIPATGGWTNTANAAWLHLSPANQSGAGSTDVVFSFDANPSVTRSSTLTIGDQMLTVTQAGSTYGAAGKLTTLVSSGLSNPSGVAVDGAGNVYIADTGDNAIKEWTAINNTVTTLVSSGLSGPGGVAVDGAGNVYIADTTNNAIREWTAANSNLTTLVSSGLSHPPGVAVDGAGNVYIADTGHYAIKEWTAAHSVVITLESANFGLSSPVGVAVDGAGKLYFSDTYYNAIRTLTAGSKTPTMLIIGLNQPSSVAVDSAGNVYFADTDSQAVKELPYAFVDPSDRLEGLAAGTDVCQWCCPPRPICWPHSLPPVTNRG